MDAGESIIKSARPSPTHLRRTSASFSQHGNGYENLISPSFTRSASYNAKTGEISLPASPPLHGWSEKPTSSNRDGNEHDEKRGKPPPYSRPARSGRRITRRITITIPKPWITLMILAAFTLFITLVTSILRPASSNSNFTAAALLTRLPFTIPTISSTACNPYSAAGILTADYSDPDNNRWSPLDPKCSPPGFLRHLRADSTKVDFSWLYNRTALIIGDSISSEHVDNFCNLMGEESEVVRASHKYSPTPAAIRPATQAKHSLDKPARLTTRNSRGVRDASLPRVCYIAKYDFLLASVFHFGLDQEDYWRDSGMPQYTSPGMFEHRITDLIAPLVANFQRDGRTNAPDFIEVSSGTWDLARWATQDILAEKNTETGLTQDRVTWYRFRVGQLLERVREAFPNVKVKTWRTMHYPVNQAAETDYFMDKVSSRVRAATPEPTAPLFSHNRIHQLDQAVRSLLVSPTPAKGDTVVVRAPHDDFRLNEFGTILKGQEAHQRDRLHGQALPGSYIWGDIMLFELWRGVSGRR